MATTDAPLSSIVKVPAGGTAVLTCNSNDFNHNFMFWLFDTDKVVGPNNYYDERKYKYEVLSGKLHIDNVTPAESGIYRCVSRKLDGSGIAVGQVELVVSETFTTIAPVTLVAILVSIFVLISCAVLYWRLRKSWSKPGGHGHDVVAVGDIEDDADGYNLTTVPSKSQPGHLSISSTT